MPKTRAPLRLDIAQLEGWVNALADQFADRVLERISARMRNIRPADQPPAPATRQFDGPRLIRMKELRMRVSLSQATIYRMIRDGEFPKPKKLGTTSAWLESEIDEWIAGKLSDDAS